MTDFLVIGGGAAGMAAAIAAAECGDSVVLLERMDRVGKKLLATGNGRCNLINVSRPRYPGGADFAEKVLDRMGAAEQKKFWNAHGLRLREEAEGRVYPACGQATAVLDTLRMALRNGTADIRTGVTVQNIVPAGKSWSAVTDQGDFSSKRILIAGGGMAQSKLGSDGSCLELLRRLNIPVTKPRPALTQIETDTGLIKGLSGIRTKGAVSILRGEEVLHREKGEILFADYGISGVCTMQCSRYAFPGETLQIDLCPGMGMEDADDLRRELTHRKTAWQDTDLEQLLTGLCVPRLAGAVMKAAGVRYAGRKTGSLTPQAIRQIARCASCFRLEIRGVKGFDAAQVTAGGADCRTFDPENLECRVYPGLHAAGEVLDVDGDCGGFNLMFAFGSGILAGLNGRNIPWQK